MTTIDHSGVKGMKKYQHKFGKWQPQAKYANGQPDPHAEKKSKDIEDIGRKLSKEELSKITRDKTYKLSKNSVHSDVAYVDGKPASFLELYKDEGYGKGQVSINVATAPEFRGQGLSKKLVKKVLDNPPEGVTEIYWETDTDNKASSGVAKSLGFEKDKDYGEGDDNYVYKVKEKEPNKRLMEEARAKKMKHSDIHKGLVHSALMAKFEEELYHSDSFEHWGVKGMKKYIHKFGKWQSQAKYANGQPDPNAKDNKKESDEDKEKRLRESERRTAEETIDTTSISGVLQHPWVANPSITLQGMDGKQGDQTWHNNHALTTTEAKILSDRLTKKIDKYMTPKNAEDYRLCIDEADKEMDRAIHAFDNYTKDDEKRRGYALDYLAASQTYSDYVRKFFDSGGTVEWKRDGYTRLLEHDADFYNIPEMGPYWTGFNMHGEEVMKLAPDKRITSEERDNIEHSDHFEHSGVKGQKYYTHKFGDWEEHAKYAMGVAKERVNKAKDKAKAKVTEKAQNTVKTINKAKEKAKANQEYKRQVRENKKIANQMAKEEKEHIRKLHNDKAEEMTTEELKERNERMKLIKQYNDAYNAVYPDETKARKEARRQLVNTALQEVAKEAPKKIIDYAIGSTNYGKRKMEADIKKKELDLDTKVQDNKKLTLEIEKSRINNEENRRKALKTAADNKLKTTSSQIDRHKDRLNRLTAKADLKTAKGKGTWRLERAIKKENKLIDALEKELQKGNEQYANKIEGIYKESVKTNLTMLSKQGTPKEEYTKTKKGIFGGGKYVYKKTYQ